MILILGGLDRTFKMLLFFLNGAEESETRRRVMKHKK